MNFQSIRIGFDLDGVIAQHSLGGLWVQLRKLKEKILKKRHSSCYYYPSMLIEKRIWMLIDSRKRPFADEKNIFNSLVEKKELKFYLVTGRFQFLEKLTRKWLTKHDLINNFRQLFINIEDIDPIVFKAQTINDLKLNFFVDDDLETINALKKKTKAEFFWIVPPHKDKSENEDPRPASREVASSPLSAELKSAEAEKSIHSRRAGSSAKEDRDDRVKSCTHVLEALEEIIDLSVSKN